MARLEDLFGEVSEVDPDVLEHDTSKYVLEDETVDRVFIVIDTLLCFTEHRLLVVTREGLTGAKTEYRSVPYSSIRDFSVDTPGRFERDGELRIWLTGMTSPLRYTVDDRLDDDVLYRVLSSYVVA